MEITAREEMLAINKDRSKFTTLSNAEVHACNRVGVQFLCPFVSMATQSQLRGCLKAIFLGDAVAMENSCSIRFLSDAFMMRRINDTAFLVFARQSTSVSVTCKMDTVLLDAVSYTHLTLPTICSV